MNCHQAKSLFSSYLDGAVTGRQMHDIAQHLGDCTRCSADYALLRQTQNLVADLGRPVVPADLALKLRVALSKAAAETVESRWEGFLVRLQNALDAFMLPATAGLVTAIVVFGLLIGFFALPPTVSAANDVPTLLYTPPEWQGSQFSVGNINADSVVVETDVDANGHVQDFHVLSAPPGSEETIRQINNVMLFTIFRPATSFGQPAPGRVVLSFSKISVRG